MARLWISGLFAAVVSTVAVISGAVADAAPLALRAADLSTPQRRDPDSRSGLRSPPRMRSLTG